MRRAFGALLLAGCGGETCDLGSVLDRGLAGDVVDCGSIALGDTTGLMEARDCVQSARTASGRFRVIFDVQGIDSHVARAFAVDASGEFEYIFDSYGGNTSRRWTCDAIVEITPCDMQELARSLCLMCTQPRNDPASQCSER